MTARHYPITSNVALLDWNTPPAENVILALYFHNPLELIAGDGVLLIYLIYPSVPGEFNITAVTVVSFSDGSVNTICIADVVPLRSTADSVPPTSVFLLIVGNLCVYLLCVLYQPYPI